MRYILVAGSGAIIAFWIPIAFSPKAEDPVWHDSPPALINDTANLRFAHEDDTCTLRFEHGELTTDCRVSADVQRMFDALSPMLLEACEARKNPSPKCSICDGDSPCRPISCDDDSIKFAKPPARKR